MNHHFQSTRIAGHKIKVIQFFLISTLLLAFGLKTSAQNESSAKLATQAIYVDVGAIPLVAIHGLVNYERQLIQRKKVKWIGRFGLGVAANPDGGFGGLLGGTMLTGQKNSHFEANLGLFVGSETGETFTTPLVEIGYRYQKPQGGFLFKAKVGNLGLGFGFGYAF